MSHGKREPGVPPKVKKVKKKVPTVTLPVEEEEASGVLMVSNIYVFSFSFVVIA